MNEVVLVMMSICARGMSVNGDTESLSQMVSGSRRRQGADDQSTALARPDSKQTSAAAAGILSRFQ